MATGQHTGLKRCVTLRRSEAVPNAATQTVGAAPPADHPHRYRTEDAGCPARLLAEAVAASYAEALAVALDGAGLRWSRVDIEVEAHTTTACAGLRLDAVVITATIQGGVPGRDGGYRRAVKEARDVSLIARAIRGNVVCKLGEVTIVTSGLPVPAAHQDPGTGIPPAPFGAGDRV